MHLSTRTAIVVGALSVAVLVGAGLATYLLGGHGEEGRPDGAPLVDFSKPPERSYEPTEALRLAWGQGPSDVWVDTAWDALGSTLDSFSVTDEGDILISDHPATHIGARVRRFAPDGRIEATWMTPGGSVSFEPFGTGIMYVQTGGASPGERVVLVSEDGSVETSFPVDPEIHSTALYRTGDFLVLTTEVPELAVEPEALRVEPLAWPVVRLTAEGPIPASVRDPVPAAGADTDGQTFRRLVEADGWTVTPAATQTVTLADGRSLRIPGTAVPLGVDGDVVWMIMPRSEAPVLYLDRAGWPYGAAPEAEVLAARVDGTLVGRVIVRWSPVVGFAKRQFLVTRDGFWQIVGDEEGVSVLRYSEVAR